MKYEGIKEVQNTAYESNAVVRKRIKKKGSKVLTLVMFQTAIVLVFFAALLMVNILGVDSKIFDVIKAGFALN
ncbi:MAG: hypothetical protein EOM87_07095 [Clostridia bacterium]|nr:hypothetical protein [Clostridia bacterium]